MQEVRRVRDAHLVGAGGRVGHVVHPVTPGNGFRQDGPGLRPFHVPAPDVRGHDHAVPLPAPQVAGAGEGELGVPAVVSGVGQVEGRADLHEARVLDAATALELGLRHHRGRRLAGEVDSVHARGQPQPRRALRILGAVQHHVPLAVLEDGRIEHAGGLESVALGHEDRLAAVQALPGPEGWRIRGRSAGMGCDRCDEPSRPRRFHGAAMRRASVP